MCFLSNLRRFIIFLVAIIRAPISKTDMSLRIQGCPKKGIGPPTFLFLSDGIGTRKILFDQEGSGFLGTIHSKIIPHPTKIGVFSPCLVRSYSLHIYEPSTLERLLYQQLGTPKTGFRPCKTRRIQIIRPLGCPWYLVNRL